MRGGGSSRERAPPADPGPVPLAVYPGVGALAVVPVFAPGLLASPVVVTAADVWRLPVVGGGRCRPHCLSWPDGWVREPAEHGAVEVLGGSEGQCGDPAGSNCTARLPVPIR